MDDETLDVQSADFEERSAYLLQALGNPKRFLIVDRLLRGEAGLPELCVLTNSSPALLSRNLAMLRILGLVSVRSVRQHRFYEVRRSESAPLRAILNIASDYAAKVQSGRGYSRS